MTEKANPITINGSEFTFQPGETILDVARRNAIDIPTLCHLKAAIPTGACRVCLVEVQGARSLVASCAMPAAPRMVVNTESPKVVTARRLVIQLLLASGNHNCLMKGSDGRSFEEYAARLQRAGGGIEPCPAWGDCRLQELAWRYGLTGGRFSPTPVRYPLEDVNPFIVRDFARCILCGRCVQACNEVQVNQAIHFGYPRRQEQDHRGRRPALPGVRLRLLRRVRPGLPDGSPGGEGCPRQGPAGRYPEKRPHHLHLLRCRLPDGAAG